MFERFLMRHTNFGCLSRLGCLLFSVIYLMRDFLQLTVLLKIVIRLWFLGVIEERIWSFLLNFMPRCRIFYKRVKTYCQCYSQESDLSTKTLPRTTEPLSLLNKNIAVPEPRALPTFSNTTRYKLGTSPA